MENIALYLLVLIIPAIASYNISINYNKYKRVNNKKAISGFEVARKILDENDLKDMYIVEVRGEMSDHYDSSQKVIRLSRDVFHGETVAAAAIAAHECGHAIQDKDNYTFMRIRSTLCPVVNLITYAAYVLFILSICLQAVDMLLVAVVVVLFSLIFQIVTLPVEFDASKRALEMLKKYDLLDKNEHEGSEKVLKAAAFTYVAAVLSSVLNLIRLLMIANDRRD